MCKCPTVGEADSIQREFPCEHEIKDLHKYDFKSAPSSPPSSALRNGALVRN